MRFPMNAASITYFLALASAAAVNLERRSSPIDVQIQAIGNSGIKARITNTGATDLKIFKTGSILDSLAVEKAEVSTGAEKVAFDGVRLRLHTSDLTEDSFETIPASHTLEVQWDIAQVHDLSRGGKYDIAAKGALSYADGNGTKIAGITRFASNTISVEVNGADAAKVRQNFHKHVQRAILQNDCTGTQRSTTTKALQNCQALAAAASSAAASGPAAKMEEFFKSSTAATRNAVANVFSKVATECGSTTSGVSKQYCTDIFPACTPGVIAYTVPSSSYIVNCPTFFIIPPLSKDCHAQDQATTQIHETTHLAQIQGTTDQTGCYGYACAISLTADQNLYHADTFALFANAIYAGC